MKQLEPLTNRSLPASVRRHLLPDLPWESGVDPVPRPGADVMVLAGNVPVGSAGIHWSHQQGPARPMVYLIGNHEYYHHFLPELTKGLKRKTAKIAANVRIKAGPGTGEPAAGRLCDIYELSAETKQNRSGASNYE